MSVSSETPFQRSGGKAWCKTQPAFERCRRSAEVGNTIMICSSKGVTKWPKKITRELASKDSLPERFIQSAAKGIWSSACPKGKCRGQVTSIRCSKLMVSHLSSRCVVTARRDNNGERQGMHRRQYQTASGSTTRVTEAFLVIADHFHSPIVTVQVTVESW